MKTKQYFGVLATCLSMLVSSATLALTVNKAKIKKGMVVIQGSDAVPDGDIFWEGVIITQADHNGNFKFKTVIPPKRDCSGHLEDRGDEDNNVVNVVIKNCRMNIRTFYIAPQDTQMVPPGELGDVSSHCDLGDFAVSGNLVIRADNFRMIGSGVVTDGATGVQRWGLFGINEGSDDADIRVSAICADVELSNGHTRY